MEFALEPAPQVHNMVDPPVNIRLAWGSDDHINLNFLLVEMNRIFEKSQNHGVLNLSERRRTRSVFRYF